MRAKLKDEDIYIFDSYFFKETIKVIRGRLWSKDNKAWIIPYSDENLILIKMLSCELDEELSKRNKKIIINEAKNKVIQEIETIPTYTELYSYQVEAFNKACNLMSIFCGR